MELKTYLTILARRWQIIVVVMLTAIGMSLYANRSISYQAETRLQVITPTAGTLGNIYHETSFASRLMNTYAQIATSNQLKKELRAKLGVETLPDLNVKIIPDSEVIQITAESREPALAAQAANGLAELVIAAQDELIADNPLSEELNLLNRRKAELEAALSQDQQKYDLVVQNYSQTAAKIAILERSIARRESAPEYAADPSKLEKDLAPLNQQYQELLTSYNEYAQQLLLIRQLMQNDQTAYFSLLERIDVTQSADLRKADTQNIQVISPAFEPSIPMFSRSLLLVLGFLVGAVVAVMLAFIVDNLDTRIFGPDQINTVTTAPVLGRFPRPRSHKPSITLTKNEYLLPQSEYRILCKKIMAALQAKKARTILVTSPNPSEGKSVITAGIAAGLAESNYRVLVVDANLHWPEQRNLYPITGEQDLNNYLRGESDNLEDLIRKNVKPGIDLFPALARPNDSAGQLQVNQLRDLFKQVKMYDAILVDSPALLATIDAYNLATVTDAVIIVAQQGYTTITDIKSISSYLEDLDSKLVGIVINQMPRGTDINYSHKQIGWWARLKARAGKLVPRVSRLEHTN